MLTAIDMVGTNLGSGTKTYIINFCKQLNRLKLNKNIFIFITNDYLREIGTNNNDKIKYIVKRDILKNSFLRMLWMQFILPFELKFLKVTQLYSPMNIGPIFIKLFNIKLILGLYSNLPWLFFSKMPGNLIRNFITKYIMQFSIHTCESLIVASKNAKKEIVDILSLDPAKVKPIYLGIDDVYLEEIEKVKLIENFNYNNYILSILSCVKYHNIINLLKAFKKIILKENKSLRFVIVMQILDKKYYKEILDFIKNNFDDEIIIIFSNLNNKHLTSLYRNAHFYIFSSYCEVFGLTTLEAMSQNCPVIVSDKSSLPEINEDAAEYFDPDDINQTSKKMISLLLDKDKKNKLINNGKNHYKKFNWKKTVLETTKILTI